MGNERAFSAPSGNQGSDGPGGSAPVAHSSYVETIGAKLPTNPAGFAQLTDSIGSFFHQFHAAAAPVWNSLEQRDISPTRSRMTPYDLLGTYIALFADFSCMHVSLSIGSINILNG